MLVQATTSRSTLQSHQDVELVPHSVQLRRLLTRLDKSELIRLALQWLASTKPHHLPPTLSRRQPAKKSDAPSEAMLHYQAVLDLNEERRARSLKELQLLWGALMVHAKVPKARAVERIISVDWVDGLSYGMIAEVDLIYGASRRMSRTWTAVKLVYDEETDPEGKGFNKLAPLQLQDRFSTELAHYFEHHIHLRIAERGGEHRGETPAAETTPTWSSQFTYFRVALAPSPADVCATGLHILHIPRSPYLLISGGLGRGNENREIALSALAQAAGAETVNYPKPAPGSLQAKRLELDEMGEDPGGNRRTLGELRGKDPLALREVLIDQTGGASASVSSAAFAVGVAGGGKAREMRSADGAEDGPLVAPLKRRREQDVFSIGVRLPTPPATSEEDEAVLVASEQRISTVAAMSSARVSSRGQASPVPTPPPPRHGKEKARETIRVKAESRREARELFGLRKGKDEDLPRIERIDYELFLAFPKHAPYKTPVIASSAEEAEAYGKAGVKLRIEGTHVLAGLRKLVEAGMDQRTSYRAQSEVARSEAGTAAAVGLAGLPSWMTEVRGTKVVVEPPGRGGAEDDDDTSRSSLS